MSKSLIEIDGGQGEGGGQILRTALSLACITGKAFRIRNIRKSRSKPGLMRQHLVAVQAAARIAAAELSGEVLGSQELLFVPGPVSAGNYEFDIGTAGSTPLVLQTIIPPLVKSAGTSRLRLIGGTHVPFSPSWHYLAEVFAPALARLGGMVDFTLESCGFYPKGGGRVGCRVQPASRLLPLHLEERGKLLRVSGYAAVGNLPRHIAEREAHAALTILRAELGRELPMEVEIQELKIYGQGTFIFLKAEYDHVVTGFTVLGERGKPAERVGEEAAGELLAHHRTGMPVDPHLADQLVLYLGQADAPSVFTTSRISSHLLTNLMVTSLFLEMESKVEGVIDQPGRVIIKPGRGGSG
ncbi:RNA 3'-terminal phosphate cyclase [Geomonas sp.]|uniref:RNA 3'-terminal phosphate cyclase n=1 Tax=Geomonas sp. TaxID=2651584 RepID=UPI002B49A58C|nr:RNA 3'-terminal phosphate cyclase [Geomonas sp.]HJV35883.1 RNA 3'-terminal phosphate cyclase [Geomonas sp.]